MSLSILSQNSVIAAALINSGCDFHTVDKVGRSLTTSPITIFLKNISRYFCTVVTTTVYISPQDGDTVLTMSLRLGMVSTASLLLSECTKKTGNLKDFLFKNSKDLLDVLFSSNLSKLPGDIFDTLEEYTHGTPVQQVPKPNVAFLLCLCFDTGSRTCQCSKLYTTADDDEEDCNDNNDDNNYHDIEFRTTVTKLSCVTTRR